MGDLNDQVSAQHAARIEHDASVQERLENLERLLSKTAVEGGESRRFRREATPVSAHEPLDTLARQMDAMKAMQTEVMPDALSQLMKDTDEFQTTAASLKERASLLEENLGRGTREDPMDSTGRVATVHARLRSIEAMAESKLE